MKNRIVLSVLLILMISVSVNSKASASPWRHCGHGYYRPAVVYCPPPPPVRYCAPRVYVNAYQEPVYYRPRYCEPRHYERRGCYGHRRGYDRY